MLRARRCRRQGATEGFARIDVSAPPMLSLAEARRVQPELRRALGATAR